MFQQKFHFNQRQSDAELEKDRVRLAIPAAALLFSPPANDKKKKNLGTARYVSGSAKRNGETSMPKVAQT